MNPLRLLCLKFFARSCHCLSVTACILSINCHLFIEIGIVSHFLTVSLGKRYCQHLRYCCRYTATAPSLGGLVQDFREPHAACLKISRNRDSETSVRTVHGRVLPPPSECKQGSTVYGYPTAPAESSPLPRSVSRALLYTAIQQPLLSPPPSLGV